MIKKTKSCIGTVPTINKDNIVVEISERQYWVKTSVLFHLLNGIYYKIPLCCIVAFARDSRKGLVVGYHRRLQLRVPVVTGESYFSFGVKYVPCLRCAKRLFKNTTHATCEMHS
jgi:hypothetical protein